MKCKLVDVFTNQKFNGNGLTIFSDADNLSPKEMLVLTQEMRQFESIFLCYDNDKFIAKIYTMEEELDFAGHPLLGLAYHLHEEYGKNKEHQWDVQLNKQIVRLSSSWNGDEFIATMNQGKPKFIKTLSHAESAILYSALNLETPCDLTVGVEVVTTGLPYVILPVVGCLDKIKFTISDLTPLLEPHGAKFLYVLDIKNIEGRTWDNAGKVEDIATGSAAGPAAAYLYKNGLIPSHKISIRQGRFVGRPSEIVADLVCDDSEILEVKISGNVVKVADISFV